MPLVFVDSLIIRKIIYLVRKLHEIVKDREAWHSVVHGVAKIWTHLSD